MSAKSPEMRPGVLLISGPLDQIDIIKLKSIFTSIKGMCRYSVDIRWREIMKMARYYLLYYSLQAGSLFVQMLASR